MTPIFAQLADGEDRVVLDCLQTGRSVSAYHQRRPQTDVWECLSPFDPRAAATESMTRSRRRKHHSMSTIARRCPAGTGSPGSRRPRASGARSVRGRVQAPATRPPRQASYGVQGRSYP